MQKRTREIIALGLLAVFAILAICGVSWYIFIGHRWNEAASIIDDNFGNMNGYTVVLYEGMLSEKEVHELVSSARISGAVALMNAGNDFWLVDEEGNASPFSASRSQASIEAQNQKAETIGISGAVSSIESGEVRMQAPLTLEECMRIYSEKNAGVITLHVDEPERYSEPIIVTRNGKRIGIFSASSHRPELSARKAVKELRRDGVDYVICIIDDLDAVRRGLGRVNIAICTDIESMGRASHYMGMTYVVGVPFDGQIGAAIMSPSGFLSSKTIESQ